MKKILLPLILVLLLTFVIGGYSADLYGTYDQRIKLTVHAADIDVDVTWFPVVVNLTNAQGEEVFTEMTADADFDRVAFTTSDESTQLYADCELFDDSEQKAIYHVSKTGWVLDDTVNTDFYMYYDKDAAHNTTYISKSGGVAAQSVWDGSFAAVYHMQDTDPGYTIVNHCDVTTDWTATDGTRSIDTTDRHSGIASIKLVTDPAVGEGYVYYNPAGNWDWSSKTYLKLWMKGDTAESGELYIFDAGENWERWAFTYPTVWTLMEFDLSAPTSDDGTGCGDWSDINQLRFDINAAEKTARYDEIQIWQAGTNIIVADSTSNHYDMMKLGVGEPVEIAGNIGMAQDFDGTDDFCFNRGHLIPTTDPWMFEAIIHPTNNIFFGGGGLVGATWAFNATSAITYCVAGGTQVTLDHTNMETDRYNHYVFNRTGSTFKIYLDGAYDNTTATQAGDMRGCSHGFMEKNLIGAFWDSGASATHSDSTIDEVRYHSAIRADAWIKASNATLTDVFLTYGNEERLGITWNGIVITKWNGITITIPLNTQ